MNDINKYLGVEVEEEEKSGWEEGGEILRPSLRSVLKSFVVGGGGGGGGVGKGREEAAEEKEELPHHLDSPALPIIILN